MNYPLISEYIEAIKSAEDNFDELRYLRPVLSDDALPVMTSGNFAVVFKMRDERDGRLYAVKCFTKEQEGRAEAYHQITEELKDVDSPYLVSLRYLDKELFVDTKQTDETEFPVLLMDWVEGKTLDKYLRENLDDKYALEMLAYRFSQLAQWLISQPFAHGDLKPDNIIVREDGSFVLVDYDGMYVPAMKGQKARELGSPDFRHPLRTENDFDEHIDDFPLVSILLSLKAISINPQFLAKYGATDRLIFSEKDYCGSIDTQLRGELFSLQDSDTNIYVYILSILLHSHAYLETANNYLKVNRIELSKLHKNVEYSNVKTVECLCNSIRRVSWNNYRKCWRYIAEFKAIGEDDIPENYYYVPLKDEFIRHQEPFAKLALSATEDADSETLEAWDKLVTNRLVGEKTKIDTIVLSVESLSEGRALSYKKKSGDTTIEIKSRRISSLHGSLNRKIKSIKEQINRILDQQQSID